MMLSKHNGYITDDEVDYKRYRGQTTQPLRIEKSSKCQLFSVFSPPSAPLQCRGAARHHFLCGANPLWSAA